MSQEMAAIHLLGGLSSAEFLREYWQKKPLLIRQALPGFSGLLDKQALVDLACHEDAQSRLVQYHQGEWDLRTGPFCKQDFKKLSKHWTLLVQDVNHFLPAADRLLRKFNFISYARLDDLMVSFAPDGAGVGPHVDSYDVFLLQGLGKRCWQISAQQDQSLIADAPLRLLQNFQAEQEYLLEAGDMLYLPPNYAHNGVAVGDSMTYSIGFRAPTYQDLMQEFFSYLQDNLLVEGRYHDPEVKPARDPAKIDPAMIAQVTQVLTKISYGQAEIENFLGRYLSEPKVHCFFEPLRKPLTRNKFLQLAQKNGLELDPKTQMLFSNRQLFVNGEGYPFSGASKAILKKLANQRKIRLEDDTTIIDQLYDWYVAGFLAISSTP